MTVFVAPQHVYQLHVAHAGYLEGLVQSRTELVATHVHIVVPNEKRLHDAVGNRLTVGRRVLAYLDHLPKLDGLV